MRLIIKKSGRIINEFEFDSGPIYIGRYKYNQVFLPDLSVSRQHAAIFTTLEGKWVVEDMDSANRTFLNGEDVHKSELKTGDVLRISDYTIEIDLEAAHAEEKPIHLEDTLIPDSREVKLSSARHGSTKSEYPRDIIIRKPELEHAPDLRLPAGRIRDFIQATELICSTDRMEELIKTLLNIVLGQFKASQAWCALRDQPQGPMVYQEGKKRSGSVLMLNDIPINQKVTEAIGKNEFILLPRISSEQENEKIQSAMIAPLIDPSGCFGVLYAANSPKEEYYNLSDLDYLMLLSIHTAAIVENF